MKYLDNRIQNLIAQSIIHTVARNGCKFGLQFKVKYKRDFQQNHDVIEHDGCPESECTEDYIGETVGRLSERALIL